MSFWKGVMNVFGFGGDNEEDEEEYHTSLPTYAAQTHPIPVPKPIANIAARDNVTVHDETLPEAEKETSSSEVTLSIATDESLPTDLFDAVIEKFNAIQPEFISKCLSTDAQRVYIINSISDSLKRRIANVTSSAASTEQLADNERMRQRINTLEAEAKELTSLRQENRKLNLSVERQKRAMLDRINDLEAQVAKNHADKEKFFSGKHNPADTELINVTNAKVEELTKVIAERDATIEQLTKDISEHTSANEQYETKMRMSDEMINSLRNQLASVRNEYEDTCKQQQCALEQIHNQVEAFEQIKAKYESRIAELKGALKDAKDNGAEQQITKLNEENASLRHTIENNLYNQANSEAKLRDEIKRLTLELNMVKSDEKIQISEVTDSDNVTPSGERSQQRRRGRPRKVKIDDELDNTDWFSSHKDDPDFGYHEPPRRPSNDNAAQLSLF